MIRAVSLQKSGLFKSEVTRTSMVPCFVLSPFPPAIRSTHRDTTGMESSRGGSRRMAGWIGREGGGIRLLSEPRTELDLNRGVLGRIGTTEVVITAIMTTVTTVTHTYLRILPPLQHRVASPRPAGLWLWFGPRPRPPPPRPRAARSSPASSRPSPWPPPRLRPTRPTTPRTSPPRACPTRVSSSTWTWVV